MATSRSTGALVQRLADRLGLMTSPTLARDEIVILRSNQLSTLQTVIDWLQTVALWLIFVVLALYAVAIWLARGRRREAVRACGIGIVVVGIVLVLVRTVGGDRLVDTLAKLPQNRDAAAAAWDILTEQLADATTTVIGVGLLTIAWAWLAGPGRRPVAFRRSLAAGARSHPSRVWLAFGAVVLLLVLWAPTDAARRLLPVVVLTALAALGLELLQPGRRRECPPRTGGRISLPRPPPPGRARNLTPVSRSSVSRPCLLAHGSGTSLLYLLGDGPADDEHIRSSGSSSDSPARPLLRGATLALPGRARRGASGSLNPQSASAGPSSLSREHVRDTGLRRER